MPVLRFIAIYSKGKEYRCLVDAEDFDLVAKHKWFLHPGGYAYASPWNGSRKNRKNIVMHRLIMGFPTKKDVDHKNRNKLDNRRANLRLATRSQNVINKPVSGVRSKTLKDGRKRWSARVKINQKEHHLGVFDTKEEAQRARGQKEWEHFGEFAHNYQHLISI